jgi:hypothetical protein
LVLKDARVESLLNHEVIMTATLKVKVNGGRDIEVKKIFERDDDKGICIRAVILRDAESQKILSIGLIKIDLDNLSAEFKRDLDGTYKAFGELNKQHKEHVEAKVQQFYKIYTP